MGKQRMTRRRALSRGLLLGAGGALLGACAGLPGLGEPAGRGPSGPAVRPALRMWSIDPGELKLKNWLSETVAQIAREGDFTLTLEYHDFTVAIDRELDGLRREEMPDLSLTFLATEWARRGWARDVEDLYQELGREGGGWYAAADAITSLNGRRTGIPIVFDLDILFARRDLCRAAGISLPFASYDALVDGLRGLTTGGRYGLGLPRRATAGRPLLSVVFAHGGRLFDRGGAPSIDTPRNRAALAAYADLTVRHHVVPPPVATWQVDDVVNAYLADQVAIVASNPLLLMVAGQRQPALLAATTAMPWPAARGGAPAVAADSPQFVVSQRSLHADRALQVVRRLMSRQSYPALLASVKPFGFATLQGYRTIPVYQDDPLMHQIQHDVVPHAVARHADGARTPVLDAISETLDREVGRLADGDSSLTEALTRIAEHAQREHDALKSPPA